MVVDCLLFLVLKAFQQLLRLLPEGLASRLGVLLGRGAFLVLSERRHVAISNVKRISPGLPDRAVQDTVKRCFENLGINFIEVLRMPYVPKDEYETRFRLENREFAEEVLQQNKGIFALVFHYANWEIMGVASHLLQREVIALARPLKKHRLLNNFLNKLRHSAGLTVIPNRETAKEVMRLLKGNRIVAILGDQREKRSRGVYVELFGEKVPTSKGIAALSMKTGAPVLPVYMKREGFLRYTIVFNRPIDIERQGNVDELIYRNTRKVNEFLETLVSTHPEEWLLVHRRFGRKQRV